jgi:D-alanyl-lipoteichoic acid acyltransferase DltB (MBOAT superfamily)
MEKAEKSRTKRNYFIINIFFNLGTLFAFKYLNFFNSSLQHILNNFNIFYDLPLIKFLLPVGISFYTFIALGYSIDVFRGTRKAEYHFGYFAAFISFFPQLLAGPIARSTQLLPQFFENREFDSQRVSDGLKLMLWGFFKKLVIADRLAILVNQVYNTPQNYEGFALLLATYFFAFQIYCDFSGYSDIAIGAAQVLGFKLMDNFKRPYYASSISDFWNRWHISLSTWLRDYLFLPLAYYFTRKMPGKNYLKLRSDKLIYTFSTMITFLLCGLWHGASWTFVIWGAIHGFYLIVAVWTKKLSSNVYTFLKIKKASVLRNAVDIFITFHLVLIAWVFFKANSLSDAVYIITHIFPLKLNDFIMLLSSTGAAETALGLTKRGLILAIISICILEIVHFLQSRGSVRQILSQKPILLRWAIYYLLIISIISFGEFHMQEFIYFQF